MTTINTIRKSHIRKRQKFKRIANVSITEITLLSVGNIYTIVLQRYIKTKSKQNVDKTNNSLQIKTETLSNSTVNKNLIFLSNK